jgi:tetrahydromethanopterin S-methyltransferase subunit B
MEENDTSKVKQHQEDDVLYYDVEKIDQRRKDLESKRNDLYHRLAYQDTVSSARMKSKPQGEKILSSYEKKMIVEEEKKAVNDARRCHRSASVQPDQVFERLMTRGMEAALKNQMVVAKLVQEQKEWMQNRV